MHPLPRLRASALCNQFVDVVRTSALSLYKVVHFDQKKLIGPPFRDAELKKMYRLFRKIDRFGEEGRPRERWQWA